jgi:hypothetical protein
MARRGVAGIALALALVPCAAFAAPESPVGAPPMPPVQIMRSVPPGPQGGVKMVPVRGPMPPMAAPGGPDRWTSVPGGFASYQRPGYGYMLPRYWVAPAHFIADPRGLGLPQPAWGYGWSRYYDDAVLTDRWGRVYDWRTADDMRGPPPGMHKMKRRDRSGIVGAIVGGAVGALTGNVIAGAGSRLAGSLIGGGIGALAGQAIDKESSRGGRHHDRYAEPAPLMRPHWDMAYDPEPVAVEQPAQKCREVETVRYVTDYVPVRAKAAPRGKYVPVKRAKEIPLT